MLDSIIKATRPKMEAVIDFFVDDLRTIHTGRASAALVEDIKVNQYNTLLPIKQVATVNIPDASLIVINPWDKGTLLPIETAIRDSGLSLNPVNDGSAIRISLPPMSEDRRKELVKVVQGKGENAKVAVRTIREDAWKEIQKSEKASLITEDDRYRGEELLNKMIAEINLKIENLVKNKDREVMTV